MKYERSICQISKEWLKGRLQECVTDADGNVVAVCGGDGEMAEHIAMCLTYGPNVEDAAEEVARQSMERAHGVVGS